MKRGRGRPPVYEDARQQPALVALRIPRALEARLRQEAADSGCTMTSLLLHALVFHWEHAHDGEALDLAHRQIAKLERLSVRLMNESTRLQKKYAALVKAHTLLNLELEEAREEIATLDNLLGPDRA